MKWKVATALRDFQKSRFGYQELNPNSGSVGCNAQPLISLEQLEWAESILNQDYVASDRRCCTWPLTPRCSQCWWLRRTSSRRCCCCSRSRGCLHSGRERCRACHLQRWRSLQLAEVMVLNQQLSSRCPPDKFVKIRSVKFNFFSGFVQLVFSAKFVNSVQC